MRDYKEVTKERYEKDDFSGTGIAKNMYSCINPIGNYGTYKEIQLLRRYIKQLMTVSRKNIDEIKVLDAGCGNGLVTRLVSNLLGNTNNVYGFEYSEKRLNYCKSMNGNINYAWGNLVEDIPYFGEDGKLFDGIMVFDVLSHFRVEEDVLAALNNIYSRLSDDGLFLWYDLNAKTHYERMDADTQGFSSREMQFYARKAGFKEVKKEGYYRNISIGKRSKSIYYMATEHNMFLLELLEKILLPLKHTINIRVYRKQLK